MGRFSASVGNAEEIPCTAAGRALIDDADASAQRTTLGVHTAPQSGRLDYVSTTQIKFACYNGDKIKINGVWRDIPSAGITSANTSVKINGTAGQNLASNTTYAVGLEWTGSALGFYFSTTTTHAPSTTAGNVATEIINATAALTLIGLIRTTGTNFASALTISWFNRIQKIATAAITATRSTSATSMTEVNSETRVNFVTWAEEAVQVSLDGHAYMSAVVMAHAIIGINFDGGTTEQPYSTVQAETNGQLYIGVSVTASKKIAEGFHYATMFARVGNGSWTVTFDTVNPITVTVIVQG